MIMTRQIWKFECLDIMMLGETYDSPVPTLDNMQIDNPDSMVFK